MLTKPPDQGSGQTPAGTTRDKALFDFVVAERPIYIPNSGPPLEPISIMPAHDKDGIILDSMALEGRHVYIVGYEDKPHLQVSVKPEKIREWVSEREHERWDKEQTRLALKEQQWLKGGNKKGSRAAVPEGQKGKPERKRKRALSPVSDIPDEPVRKASVIGSAILPPNSGPGRKRKQPVQEPTFPSPKASQKSQGPSLSTPVKTGLELDTDEEDEMDANDAIALQLNGAMSSSTTPSTSRGASVLDANRAVASTSSRAARKIYEDLEVRNQKGKTISERYTSFPRNERPSSKFQDRPGMFSPPKDKSKSPSFSSNPASRAHEFGVEVEEDDIIIGAEVLSDEEDSEAEWEVDMILDEKMQKSADGKKRRFYLIKWEGEYDDTWEPAGNVGEQVVKEWKAKKGRAKGVGLDGAESEDGGLFVKNRKGKGKGKVVEYAGPPRGQVIDDDDEDMSD